MGAVPQGTIGWLGIDQNQSDCCRDRISFRNFYVIADDQQCYDSVVSLERRGASDCIQFAEMSLHSQVGAETRSGDEREHPGSLSPFARPRLISVCWLAGQIWFLTTNLTRIVLFADSSCRIRRVRSEQPATAIAVAHSQVPAHSADEIGFQPYSCNSCGWTRDIKRRCQDLLARLACRVLLSRFNRLPSLKQERRLPPPAAPPTDGNSSQFPSTPRVRWTTLVVVVPRYRTVKTP